MTDNKNKLIKVNVLIAQGDNELKRARDEISSGNFGKVRVLARRAAGFYLTALNEMFPELRLGSNFIAQIRKISLLKDLGETVKKACDDLSVRISEKEIDASASITNAAIIMNYVCEKLKLENKN